jgi:hypothetical protein
MNKQYTQLSIEERAVIMIEWEKKSSIRKIASLLGRYPPQSVGRSRDLPIHPAIMPRRQIKLPMCENSDLFVI